MIMSIDTSQQLLILKSDSCNREINLYSMEAFEIISALWVKVGWNEKYEYTFSWMGRPIIQNPEDIIRAQEVIYRVKPDVIIETGIAHGGGLIFFASLCKSMGKGRVIGVDIEIRKHNRQEIENHDLFPYISILEGNSVDPSIIDQIKSMIKSNETVIVFLDSNHTKQHVFDEIMAYHRMVTPNSYIVATDGIMRDLHDTPRGKPEWAWDNPAAAAKEFVKAHPEFEIEQPKWPFNESQLRSNITHWPDAWLRRTR